MRLRILKDFMRWAYFKEYDRWTQANNEERIIVKRSVSYGKFLGCFGLASSVGIYAAFFVGIYDFRATELINMRRVPFVVKAAVSSLVSYKMC